MYFSTKQFFEAAKRGKVTLYTLADDAYIRRHFGSNVAHYRREYGPIHMPVSREQITMALASKVLREAKKAIISRNMYANITGGSLYKWYRPWDVVPELAEFAPANGDFGVGIEVEMGFVSTEAAAEICNDCKNWKYVTADYEGGSYPIEMTFPPMHYSKINNKSQVMRYLDLLNSKRHLVFSHRERNMVGTHVNVSVGPTLLASLHHQEVNDRLTRINRCLQRLTEEQQRRYFGRIPYGYINFQRKFFECKLFNSTIDKAAVKKYINVGVGLVKLVYDVSNARAINAEMVVERLELSYNKKGFKKFV